MKKPDRSRRTRIRVFAAAGLIIRLALFVPLAGSTPAPTFADRPYGEVAVSANDSAWLSAEPLDVLPMGATGLLDARLAAGGVATFGDPLPSIRPLLGGR